VLELSDLPGFNPLLKLSFFKALGENQSLKMLKLDRNGPLRPEQVQQLAMGIAFNAKQKGALEHVALDMAFNSEKHFPELQKGLQISNFDWETWYGATEKAQKMSGDDFKKSQFMNLKALELPNC